MVSVFLEKAMQVGELVRLKETGNYFTTIPRGSIGIFMGYCSDKRRNLTTVLWLNGIGIKRTHIDYLEKLDKNT